MKNITQKIRDLLTPEDLKLFESAVESMIDEKTQNKLSDLIQLKEDELKSKYEGLAEEYVQIELGKRLSDEKAKLVESYDKKLSLLEQKIVTKLDAYLDHVISEQISDELLEKIAINETLQPVVEGIKNVFNNNHLKLGSNAESTIKTLSDSVDELKTELSESIDRRIELEGKLEHSAVYLLISEKTNGLKRSDKQRVVEMFKDKEFDEVEQNIDNYLDLIKESVSTKSRTKKQSSRKKMDMVTEGVGVTKSTKKVATKTKTEKEIDPLTIVDISNRFLSE